MERRRFLSCLGTGSAVAVLPGIGAADGVSSDSVRRFLELYEGWKAKYGEVIDANIDFSHQSEDYTRADITYEFESGYHKTITAIESDRLIIIYRRNVFVIDDPDEFYGEFARATNQSNTTTPDPGVGGGRSQPINPGDQITWRSAGDSYTEISTLPDVSFNGADVDEFGFEARARTSGAVASWNDAFAKVYRRFKIGNDGSHPNTTMRIGVPFDIYGRFEAWGGGSAEGNVLIYLANLTRNEYVETNPLVNHQQSAYGSKSYNEDGTTTIERVARPGHEYEVGLWVSTAAVGAGVAFAEADFKWGNFGASIDKVELTWV